MKFTLNGNEKKIDVTGMYTSVKNNSGTIVYISNEPNIDAAGTSCTPIQPNESLMISTLRKKFYIKGTGDIAVVSGNQPVNFFKPAGASSGGSSGGGQYLEYLQLKFENNLNNSGVGDFTITSNSAPVFELRDASNPDGGYCLVCTSGNMVEADLKELVSQDFLIDFDFKINSGGVPPYPQWRRLIWYKVNDLFSGFEISDNQLVFVTENEQKKTFNVNINDSQWHHVSLTYQNYNYVAALDGSEMVNAATFSSASPLLFISHNDYVLNGYVDNLVVRRI